jgi:hypothetical protein
MTSKLSDYVVHQIGGGWGEDTPKEGFNRVAVIRGTDIPRIREGNFSTVPFRYEKASKIPQRLLKPGDLLLEISGGSAATGQHTGRVLYITREILSGLGGNVIPASFCKLVRLNLEAVSTHYCAYFIDLLHLNKEIAVFENQSTGISNFQVNKFLEATSLPIEFEKQKTVSEFLGRIDRLRQYLSKQNTALESIAQTLFRSWFVNFDPVHAKATGNAPEAMSAELAELFPSEFEESELGLIPKGWGVTSFGDCLGHVIGGDWGKDALDEKHTQAVRVIRGTDIPDLLKSKAKTVPSRFVQASKFRQRLLRPYDLVIEVSGGSKEQSTGRALMVTNTMLSELGGPAVPTSFCRLFRPKTEKLGVILRCRLEWHYKEGNMWNYQVQSTGIANFQTPYFLSNDKMALPPEEIQEKFKKIVAPMLESLCSPTIRALGELRDHLLPRLISGKLSIGEAEKAVAELLPEPVEAI